MALETLAVCSAAGVCSTGGGAATLAAGGFVLGTTKDVAFKIYYKSREVFDGMMKQRYEVTTEEYRFYSHRELYYAGRNSEIQPTTGRVVKAVGTGATSAGCIYLASQYLF